MHLGAFLCLGIVLATNILTEQVDVVVLFIVVNEEWTLARAVSATCAAHGHVVLRRRNQLTGSRCAGRIIGHVRRRGRVGLRAGRDRGLTRGAAPRLWTRRPGRWWLRARLLRWGGWRRRWGVLRGRRVR